MKIYTKGGDQGSTSLIGGERVPKYDVRVEAYGSIDELSAQTAMLRDMLNGEDVTQFDDDLIVISRLLMHTESLMALGHGSEDKVKDLNGADIGFLEKRIDEISAVLPPIERFTLPGGHIVVSQAHICRTVCRRAERQACRAAAQYPVSSNALMFLNRLSDYFTYSDEDSPCSSAQRKSYGNPEGRRQMPSLPDRRAISLRANTLQ